MLYSNYLKHSIKKNTITGDYTGQGKWVNVLCLNILFTLLIMLNWHP